MKLRDLVRRLNDEGCVFVRHGANHYWYRNVITGAMDAVPRHREVEERLARSIIRKLSAPKDGE